MSGEPVEPALPPPDRPKRRRWVRPTIIVGSIMAVLLVLVGGGALALYMKFTQIKIIQVPGADAPADNEPVNILLMGSDNRQGKGNRGYGLDAGRSGQRSDTTILLHIAADRSRALAVSIPRDLWVEQPDCATGGQAGIYNKFNNAFDAGGAACTHELVEKITGVHINHVVVVDFNGFKQVVDALGGVEVCLEHPIHDTESKLDLPAGKTLVDGERALAFVRARKTLGDGSDIGRIKRQQAFLSAAILKVNDTQLLLNPAKVYQILDVATRSLSVSQGLDGVVPMRNLVDSVRALQPSDITFLTMPFIYRTDGANVDEDITASKPIWDAIRNDTAWPPPVTVAADGQKLTVAPKDISVRIVDYSGGTVSQERVATQLRSAGFNVSETAKGKGKKDTTQVVYASGQQDSARTLAYSTQSVGVLDTNAPGLTLEVGKDWKGVRSDIVVAKPKSELDPNRTPTKADQVVCAA